MTRDKSKFMSLKARKGGFVTYVDNNKGTILCVYVDDIIFGSTNKSLYEDFVHKMQGEFEMSMMGELNYFLGLQVKQMNHGTFLHQTKY